MGKVVITNIGKIISGNLKQPVLKADTIVVQEGKISQIGFSGEVDVENAQHIVDANGMVVTPGFIDSHTHQLIGDWNPIHNSLRWMESYLLAGVTTLISQGEAVTPGYPGDPAGMKAMSIAAAKCYKNFRPGGALKVHGGAVSLVEGFTEDDFREMAEAGVWLVAEIGCFGIAQPDKVKPMVGWARKYGMKVTMHLAPPSVPTSTGLGAHEIMEVNPDIVAHVNGGSTAAPLRDVEMLVKETDLPLEFVFNGNPKVGVEMIRMMVERKVFHRLIIGSDSPTGNGLIPTAVLRTVVQISSLNEVPAETVIAAATGTTADVFGLKDVGKIEVGRAADLLVIDKPAGSVGADALEAIEAGDIPGTAMIMVDGRIVAYRGRDTRQTARYVKVDGVEKRIMTPEDYLYGPYRFSGEVLS